jgi:hypothetical protein
MQGLGFYPLKRNLPFELIGFTKLKFRDPMVLDSFVPFLPSFGPLGQPGVFLAWTIYYDQYAILVICEKGPLKDAMA